MNGRDQAIELLTHYMSTAFRAAGLQWTIDHTAEMTVLVDALRSDLDKRINRCELEMKQEG